ncbi:insulinase family protein [Nitrospirales bacterium NOB]|nr:MAG: putative M16 family Zn-dependent peptidase [Nitrospira sp. OLB3]MBV6468493.1 putative zinc protease [Nitrospirota bacterium]MCE7965276.1 insulinase family protein [Nitrospira sp. NTP2]MCK6491796.1 insulinase family protein [Nitrospira sp.]MDL1888527.1 insulinase family protein [Nitrospirales bacterium NOB]MEB2339519.1 pitrilysin family protein [Nitrospirales bacterium]
MYRKIVLDNRLRIVAEHIPTLKSVTIGIWVNVGSRDEQPGEEGLSHFLEHMFFKGTRSRSATQISREIDALGGEMNAFTTRETTTFYVKVLDQQLDTALELLADLFYRSRFESKEVEKEKQVVLEEIRMVQDDPEDLVQELHMKHILGNHPLGRPILGQAPRIKALNRSDLLAYVRSHYDPQRTVVAVAGNFSWKRLEQLMARYFSGSHKGSALKPDRRPPVVKGGVFVQRKPLEQVHLCLGLQGLGAGHKDRYAAHALNGVLGGSVSSRLFQEVREKRGLVYSIYSFLSTYSDGGMLTVYAGTRPKEVQRVVEVVCRELKKLRTRGIDGKDLARVKNQMKGSLMLSLESSHSRMSKLAKDELAQGGHASLEQITADIDRVTIGQVHEVAQSLLDQRCLSVTALGPIATNSLQAIAL